MLGGLDHAAHLALQSSSAVHGLHRAIGAVSAPGLGSAEHGPLGAEQPLAEVTLCLPGMSSKLPASQREFSA